VIECFVFIISPNKISFSKNMKTYRMSILSDPKKLAKARRFVEEISLDAGFKRRDAHLIMLAVDEACTNIIRHSYVGDTSKKINIKVAAKKKKGYNASLTIKIRDYGKKPDVKKISGKKPRKVKPGGLGVYFIRKIMDEVVYNTGVKKGTELTLMKYLLQ